MSASFDANLAYALCYWVDSGGNLPSGWEVIWSPTGPAAGYTVVFQKSGTATYAIVSQGTKDVLEALLECEVAHQDPFPYITGNAKVARGNLDLLKITLDLRSSTGVRLGDVLPPLAQAKNQILVTGHSLGAATATLMAPYVGFLINGKKPIAALPSNVTGMTFGTPAVGDSSFANFLNNNPSNYTSYNNTNDAVPCLWSMTGAFSMPNMYLLFTPPGPHPMPEGLKLPFQNIVNNMKKNNVSYQQTKTVTFTFASIPETGKDPWLTELMYQHNTAYDIQFGITTNAAFTKGTTS